MMGKYQSGDIKTRVKQGCVMSGFLHPLVIDWVIRKTVDNRRMGMRWKFAHILEDLDFAHDLVLVLAKFTVKIHDAEEHGRKLSG